MNPLVTILISSFNRMTELREAIKSIYAQTYQNFEIRLTRDGGAPIDISDLIDDRCHIIDRRENKGLAYSFNQSIEQAQGEYVCYLGDDDIFYPDHIETLVTAIQGTECQVVYSDLYEVPYVWDDGKRLAMAKNVVVQRDFDRMYLYRFNHVLHVSVLHHRDLFLRTGVYNEEITSLLDWDMNRRMSFFTDFHHVHKVTGEYYLLVDGDERISTRERKDPVSFARNYLKVRHTRPPKPWSHVTDLAILIPMVKFDKRINRTLRNIHLFIWYPHEIYLTCPAEDVDKIKTSHPNVSVFPLVEPTTEVEAVAILNLYGDGIKTVIKPTHPVGADNMPWIEGIVNRELERVKHG